MCINFYQKDREASLVKEQCQKYGVEACTVKADVSDSQDVERLFSEISHMRGHLHTVVNNAGIRKDGPLMLMKEDDWDRVVEINLKGVL